MAKAKTPDPRTIPSGTVVGFAPASRVAPHQGNTDAAIAGAGKPLPAGYTPPAPTAYEKQMLSAIAKGQQLSKSAVDAAAKTRTLYDAAAKAAKTTPFATQRLNDIAESMAMRRSPGGK